MLGGIFEKNKIKDKIKQSDKKIENENFWKDKLTAQKILKEKKFFEKILANFNSTINELENLEQLLELAVNENMDAWFLGFTSKLVIGIYVGFDEPKTLGKYETGAKAALPVFKRFVKKVVKKKDALPFKVPKNISLVIVDA